MKRRTYILFLVFALGLSAGYGRVFQVVGTNEGRLNTTGLPWDFAYKTTMDVNGRQNELQVYAARFDEPVVEQLRAQFEQQGAKVTMQQSRTGAQGLARWENREARIVVLSPDSQPNQMVFLFYPKPGESGAPARLPIPEYPGASAPKTVTNEATGSISATWSTEDRPEQVLAYYAGALSAEGWRSVLPSGTASTQMAIYQKRDRICTIMASFRPDGPNRVTLLVKGGGL
jgi:hypothetical protein